MCTKGIPIVQAAELRLAQVQPSTQPMTPKAAIERLFTSKQIQTDWFTPSFLSQIPVSPQQVIESLKTALGAYQGVQEIGEDYLIIFDRGSVPTKIVLDASGRITGLLFEAPRAKLSSLNEAIAQFKTLPGKVSLLVLEDNKERAALNATTSLAVGSAFKLAVLEALKGQIASGKRSWSDVVELQPNWKSLPSGILQNWPDGSRLTVETLAALMISQSDNTATDSLIYWVGKEAIEAVTSRNRPFLTTRELFLLKTDQNEALLQRYRAGDEAQRRTVLNEVNQLPPPELTAIGSSPKALDVEWFFTAQELCSLIEKVADLPLMSINPGVARAKDWQRLAFKGGSEPGVLNLTTWLLGKTGKRYCVAATWNNDESLDEVRFMSLYNGLLETLK
ncbi:serine hydrolase [Allocoleopsis franciscana]|uniref:serine hydrolase n=1 Tax=Allocoleopsis franciscana TaxID=2886352 RepID=UPI001C1049AD|nr:serine hydrolase [Allocoleopsis franciscana]